MRECTIGSPGDRKLLVPQASELAEFDHFGSNRVFRHQPIQGVAKGETIIVRSVRGCRRSDQQRLLESIQTRTASSGIFSCTREV